MEADIIKVQGESGGLRPVLGSLRLVEFPGPIGHCSSYILPRQDG